MPGTDSEPSAGERHVISRDDLIAAKRAAGRERDLRDLRALERRR